MSILNLDFQSGGATPPRSKRAVKFWVGIGLIAAVLGVGSTLASTITLNNGNATEFGQGVSTSIFCGGTEQTIQVTPVSLFDNTAVDTATAFIVGQVKVTGIPAACAGVDFVVSLYDNTGNPDPLMMATDVSAAHIWYANNCPILGNTGLPCSAPNPGDPATGSLIWYYNIDGNPMSSDNSNSTDIHIVSDTSGGTFTLTFPASLALPAANLGKIVIETQQDQNGFDFWRNGSLLS